MSRPLSYSSLQLYQQCGVKYKYSYIDRLREKTRSSALCFGTSLDEALSACLLHPDKDEKEVFDNFWEKQEINKRIVTLVDSPLIRYSQSDFDEDLLLEEDVFFIKAKALELIPYADKELITWQEIYATCLYNKKHREFPENELVFVNICNWLSLRRKGHMMLEAHRKEILPKLKKIISVQNSITLNNGEDTLVGKVDLVAALDDGVPIVFDYKTSSRPYAADSAAISPQLAIYSHAMNIPTVGYIVFNKKLIKNKTKTCSICKFVDRNGSHKTCYNEMNGKRCSGMWNIITKPEVVIQIIVDKMTNEVETGVLENVETINLLIKQGIFEKNLDSCWAYGQRCPYFDKCFKGSDEGLEVV